MDVNLSARSCMSTQGQTRPLTISFNSGNEPLLFRSNIKMASSDRSLRSDSPIEKALPVVSQIRKTVLSDAFDRGWSWTEVMPRELDANSVEISRGSTKKELKISDWIQEARCSHRDAIQNYVKRENGEKKVSALSKMEKGKSRIWWQQGNEPSSSNIHA